jgi:hypothetical protein
MQPSGSKGKIGVQLLEDWLGRRNFVVGSSPMKCADLTIQGKLVEVKLSTLWAKGYYKFQQLRDQPFDLVVCLGLSPTTAHCWAFPKSELDHRWRVTKEIRGQHTGTAGKETAWLTVRPESAPEWLREFGGRLSAGLESISRITGSRPER